MANFAVLSPIVLKIDIKDFNQNRGMRYFLFLKIRLLAACEAKLIFRIPKKISFLSNLAL